MPLVSLRQLPDHAAEHRYGIPAFNVNNLEQVKAQLAAKYLCRERFEAFGCAGMATRIRAVPLEDMAARYAERALAPVIR